MINIKIKNLEYYNDEINKILTECTRKKEVSSAEYEKIIELMSEKMRLNVRDKLSSRKDVELIANQFKGFMSDYLKQAKEKGFFKANTIISNLRTLNSINYIGDRPQEGAYGSAAAAFGRIDFDFDHSDMQNMEFRKEIFFHEVTHHLIDRNIDYQFIALTGRHKKQKLLDLEQELGISVGSATRFITELLTEEMAQQLICDRRPAKTSVGVGEAELDSNYNPHYNRRYQTLGTEFIKTLSECADNNEERMMKKAILFVLDDNFDFVSMIKNNYNGKEGDLKAIFSALKKVFDRTERISYDEVENYFKITESNYTLDYQRPRLTRSQSIKISHQNKIKIQKGKQSSPRRIRIQTTKQIQTTPHFKIKKTVNSNILGNQVVVELSDVKFIDNVQQQMNIQEKQLTEHEK